MKVFSYIYNFFIALLLLLFINSFLKIVVVPQWALSVVLIIAAVLFFTKTYFRIKRR